MDYPIKEQTAWRRVDSTKISEAMDCMRKFMYTHIFGWRSTAPNNHLVFGEAWHGAMEHLLLNGYDDKGVMGSYDRFLKIYRREFSNDTDDMYSPKTPAMALKALATYAEKFANDLHEFEVLYTEISGVVLVAEGRELYFKTDNILKDRDGKIFSLEHKTGSRIDSKWRDKWLLSTQVGTYTHVMYCMYPPEQVKGIKINGAFFYKSKTPEFERVPVWKSQDQMHVWLHTTLWWLDELEFQLQNFSEASQDDEVLTAYPMNPESCTKYFGCPFLDYCTAWPNPLRYADEPPMGFKTEWWDPTTKETTHKIDMRKEL